MAKQELQSFFYTFGTSDFFPYQKGWVEVKAPNRSEADVLFRKHYPDRTEGVLNCSDVYDQTGFDVMRENNTMPSDWDVCHKVLSNDEISRRSYWVEIRNNYFSTDYFAQQDGALRASITIDAWKTLDDEEQGNVIARVLLSEHGDILVDYHDQIARWDVLAQERIQDATSQLQEYAKECGIQRPEPQSCFHSEVPSERPGPVRTCFTDQIQNAQNRAGTAQAGNSAKEDPER